ncbi:MAG: hypothetical protein H6Q90_2493, partial [Deltaproteobacteria bacterium]|nr:hypothetical protein [Deltaproteobacteria bacterium]
RGARGLCETILEMTGHDVKPGDHAEATARRRWRSGATVRVIARSIVAVLLASACSSGVVSKSRPRARFNVFPPDGGAVSIQLGDPEVTFVPTQFPLGTRIKITASWFGLCNREANSVVPSFSTSTEERCDEVEHQATVSCKEGPCEVTSGFDSNGFTEFEVVPRQVGPLMLVITYEPKRGKRKVLQLGFDILP